MALVDDLIERGNVVTGLVVGMTALVMWPLVRPLARPLGKAAIQGGISTYREARRLYDGVVAGISELAKEAMEEVGSQSAKEAGEEIGPELAKEAVEEIGPELAKEAIES